MSARRRRVGLAAARRAAGHTQESLAAALHVDRTTVIRWEAGDRAPQPFLRPRLGKLLGLSSQRLSELIDGPNLDADREPDSQAYSISTDIDAACEWVDRYTGGAQGTSRGEVVSRLARLDIQKLRERNRMCAQIRRSQLVDSLSSYYGYADDGYGTYRARCDNQAIATSIVTRPDWLDLECELSPANERFQLASAGHGRAEVPDGVAARRALHRLVEAAALDVRIANTPIYRLLDFDVRQGAIDGTVGLVPFTQYALTMDLLEGELVDALAGVRSIKLDALPLRNRYLPDLASVLNTSARLCAGGVLALCAIARPTDSYRSASDFVLLVQERSDHVLNSARRLAVIPKGFHEPLADYRAEAAISSTLRREMEEELFGRGDVDSTHAERRFAAPMHPSRLSQPMRWLVEPGAQERLRLECTGFGFNLVSGNYEYASLIIIDDEEFWCRYGGDIQANWESAGLRSYSSLDRQMIAELITDESWSDEGLFALLQGLRRLSQIGDTRVNLPAVEWDVG